MLSFGPEIFLIVARPQAWKRVTAFWAGGIVVVLNYGSKAAPLRGWQSSPFPRLGPHRAYGGRWIGEGARLRNTGKRAPWTCASFKWVSILCTELAFATPRTPRQFFDACDHEVTVLESVWVVCRSPFPWQSTVTNHRFPQEGLALHCDLAPNRAPPARCFVCSFCVPVNL